ncbi:hypothetical protein [Actinoplanes sp. NPDC026670]|uniref:Gp37-like protein n=1 Tax=Actinoplanes sp. NPDC026670 TaxID=3154700 RepID=UPI00340BF6C5
MRLDDLTVEVRDRNLNRVGQIRPEELDLEAEEDFNNVGTWTLKLAVEHPLAGVLRTPGSGIIVTGPTDVLFSGPVTQPQSEATATDPRGTLAINGVTDSILLMDSLAYAAPSYDPSDIMFPIAVGATEDKRTGPAESLMHAFVSSNIGPNAPASRRAGTLLAKLTMGANGGRGASTTKSAKYTKLGTLLSELAAPAGLGFRIIQRGAVLVFETFAVADRSATIRLDIYNSTLAGHKVVVGPPSATRVLVQGKDIVDKVTDPDLAQFPPIRNFVSASSTSSLAAESEWGRRIEVFKDDSSHDTRAELQQTGLEELAEKGLTTLSVQAVPMEDSSMPYGVTWNLGDKVAVVVEDQELRATVTGFVLKANADGTKLGALIGDPTGFSRARGVVKRITTVESRVLALETRVAAQASTTAVQLASMTATNTSGWIPLTIDSGWKAWNSTYPPAYKIINGVVYLRGLFQRGPTDLAMSAGSSYILGSLPNAARPVGGSGAEWYFPANTSSAVLHDVVIWPGGDVRLRAKAAVTASANSTWISLAGLSWPL